MNINPYNLIRNAIFLILFVFSLMLSACGGDNHSNTSNETMVLTNPKPVVSKEEALAIARDFTNRNSEFKAVNEYKVFAVNNLDNQLRLYEVVFYSNGKANGAFTVSAYEGAGHHGGWVHTGEGEVKSLKAMYEDYYLPMLKAYGATVLEHKVVASISNILGVAVKTDVPLPKYLNTKTKDGREMTLYHAYAEPYYILSYKPLFKFGNLRSKNPRRQTQSNWLMEERKQRAQAIARGKQLKP